MEGVNIPEVEKPATKPKRRRSRHRKKRSSPDSANDATPSTSNSTEGLAQGAKRSSDNRESESADSKKGSGAMETTRSGSAPGTTHSGSDITEDMSKAPASKGTHCCKGCGTFMYNSENKTVMGRGCRQWTLLWIFYVLFYIATTCYFLGLYTIILALSSKEAPRMMWVKEEVRTGRSLIQHYPSLVAIPSSDREKNPTSSLMIITAASAKHWGNKIGAAITKYEEYLTAHPNCRAPNCFQFNKADLHSSCSPANNYGYSTSKPSFLMRPSKIIGWKPQPFLGKADFESKMKELKLPRIAQQWTSLNLQESKNHVMILCQGESDEDDQLMGTITYCTSTHLDSSFYPYKNQPQYLPPFVMIQLDNPTPGIVISIECYVVAKNMEVDAKNRLGMDRFEILVR